VVHLFGIEQLAPCMRCPGPKNANSRGGELAFLVAPLGAPLPAIEAQRAFGPHVAPARRGSARGTLSFRAKRSEVEEPFNGVDRRDGRHPVAGARSPERCFDKLSMTRVGRISRPGGDMRASPSGGRSRGPRVSTRGSRRRCRWRASR